MTVLPGAFQNGAPDTTGGDREALLALVDARVARVGTRGICEDRPVAY
jgi:hypothetical protein